MTDPPSFVIEVINALNRLTNLRAEAIIFLTGVSILEVEAVNPLKELTNCMTHLASLAAWLAFPAAVVVQSHCNE